MRSVGDEGSGTSGRREAILDAATELFAEQGYHDADTQVLADRLGVGKGTLYRCFPSKRDLFLAAVDRVMVRLHGRVDGALDGVADPLEQVGVAIRTYLDFFAEHLQCVEVLIQERALIWDRTTPTFLAHWEKNLRRWRDIYGGLIAAGRIRPMPVERITDVVGHLVYGTMFTDHFADRRGSTEAQARDILDVVYLGLLSESERQAPGND